MNKSVKNVVLSTVAATLLVGCFGSGSGTSSSSLSGLSGSVIDGYIKNSKVFLDLDLDGSFTSDLEPFAITDEKGSYSISLTSEQRSHTNFNIAPLIATGGIDTDTNQAFEGKLEAPNNGSSNNLTPMTTVVSKMVQAEDLSNKTESEIKDIVNTKKETLKKVLGISSDVDISDDFISKKNTELNKVALQVQKTVELISKALDDGSTSNDEIQEKVIQTLAKKVEALKDDTTANIEKVVDETTKEAENNTSELFTLTGKILTTEVTKSIKTVSDNIDKAFEQIDLNKESGETFEDIVEKVIIVVEEQTSKLEEAIEKDEVTDGYVEVLDENSAILKKSKSELRKIGIVNELDILGVSGDIDTIANELVAITDPVIEFNNFYEVINSDFITTYPKYSEILAKINERKVSKVSIPKVNVYQGMKIELSLSDAFNNIEGSEDFIYSVTGLPTWVFDDSEEKELVFDNPSNSDVGSFTFDIEVNSGNTTLGTKKVFVEVLNINDAPTVSSEIKDASINQGDNTLSIDVKPNFADIDIDDELTYSATLEDGTILPSWVSFENGVLSATPTNTNVGNISLKVTASDIKGLMVSDIFTLTVNNLNDAPKVKTPILDTAAEQTVLFSLDIKSNFEDIDANDTLTYTATLEGGASLPSWLSFEDGIFNGTPGNADINMLTIVVIASDGLIDISDTFTLDVRDRNDSPTVSTPTIPGNITFIEDTPTNINLNDYFADVDANDTLSFKATLSDGSVLPTWITLNENILSVVGENENVGEIDIKVIATDKLGLSVSNTFEIVIENSNDAPTSSNQSFNLDSSTSLTLNGTLTGNDIDVGDTITFEFGAINGGTLTSNLDGTFTYTTDEGFTGTDTFEFSVKDTAGASSQMYTASINVTDGSLPLNKDVDDAIEKIKSIDLETENIDIKLNEAKDLLNENTNPEAEIVRLSISLAEIANDDDIASLLNLDDGSAISSLSTLNTIVRSTVMNTVTVSVKDDATNLSSVSTQKLNKVADELKKISDEFGNLFSSDDDVYTYDGENMNYNDSLALRAGILSFAAQLKQQSSYQWGSNADIEIRDYEGNEYRNINVDLAAVLNEGTVYKLTSDASSRLPEAKAFLSQAADLLLELPLGYDGDIEDEETGLTQEDKDEITSIKLSLAGTTAYTLEVDDDEDIKEVKVDLSKMYDVSTALDITSFGTNWQNLCYEGDIISVEEAKIEGTLDCKVVDWYDSYSGVTYAHFESAEAEPQTMPTADNSKIDDIVLSITKIDDTILTGQEMIDFVLEDETKVEALGTTWGNSKYSSDYLVNGNDVKVSEEYGTLKVNAYKADGISSKAQAKRSFNIPKSEIKAKIRLRDVDEVDSTTSRGSFQAVMNNINSADERIYAHIQLRNNRIQYYVGRYDSTGNIEAEDYTDYTNGNHKFAETSTANDDASVKFAVSIATSGADIIFNVSKVDGSGTVIENYDEKVITTDSSFDLGIDEARFRAEVRLSSDDGTLYDQITTPTKLRVHSFSTVDSYPDAALATLSVGDTAILTGKNPWYDIMTVNNGSITLKMYDNDDGTYVYSESETFTTDLTTTSSTFNITQAGEEGSAEIMNTVQVGEDLFKSDIKFTNTVETNESDTWGWDDHGATDIDELVTLFTNGNTYFQTANTTFMLKSNGIVAKGMFSGSDEYGDHFSYGAEVSSASWTKEDGKIKVDLSTDYKVLMSFELNSSNDIVESEINQIGYTDSDYLYTGSGALQYFENQTGINPND